MTARPHPKLPSLVTVRRSLKSISQLWIGSLIGSGSIFVINTLVARNLGTADFGIFGSVYAMATLLSIIASFGIAQFWLKAFGKEGRNAQRWLVPSFKGQLLIVLLSLTILYNWALLGPHDSATRSMLFIMGVFVVSQVIVELVSSKLQLEERYTALTLWQLLPNLLRLILIALLFCCWGHAAKLNGVASIYAATGLAFIAIGCVQLRNMHQGKFRLQGHPHIPESTTSTIPSITNVIHEAWPFGLAATFGFIYLQIDIIMLKYLGGDIQAGYYNIAFIVITASTIFPNVLYQKFLLPKYHRWINQDREKLYQSYLLGTKGMLTLGVALAIAVQAFSWYFIPLLFGVAYKPSIPLTNVLALSIPIFFMSYNTGATLVTGTYIRLKALIMAVVAGANIILNALLIPRYLAMGAAIATLLSYGLLLVLYTLAAHHLVFQKTGKMKKVG